MKFTTVSILVIALINCCNAQSLLSERQLLEIVTVHNAVATPKYSTEDNSVVLIEWDNVHALHQIQSAGLPIRRRLDDRRFIVSKKEFLASRLVKLVNRIVPVNHRWKLSPNLLTQEGERAALIVQGDDLALLDRLAKQNNLSIKNAGTSIFVSGPVDKVLEIFIAEPSVSYIGIESFAAVEEGRVLDLYLAPNRVNLIHHYFPETNGSGIVISMKERQYDAGDVDLLGRHRSSSLASADTSNHATEMATIVAGAGNSFITGRGVASHANITSSSFENLFPDSDAALNALDVKLQNHSYGTVVENFYGTLAASYDQSANGNTELLHVFSSGNSGTATAASGQYFAAPGFSNLTGNSKMAKNILVVGAADTTGNPVSISSRGPANDGRIKPEMVAYSSAGTSNAAALVSGTAALLQQEFKKLHGKYPHSALIKALLINAAEDCGPTGVDFTTGYGNLNAYRTLLNLKNGLYLEGVVGPAETKTFDLAIPPGAKNLKLTLTWNDPAAGVNSVKTLVNDLDLELQMPGQKILPWILNTAPDVTSLSAPAIRDVDRLNNVEQITLPNVDNGIFQVTVKAFSVQSQQRFFIAYQWDEEEKFEWYYPTGSDNFPYNGETGTYFYWKSTLSTATGDLQVSLDDGAHWISIIDDVELSTGHFRWENPMPVSAAAKARMVIGNETFVTDEFTISRTLFPTVGFNCSDSSLLQWDAVPGVSQYQVRKLEGNYTTLHATLSDTALVIKGSDGVNYSVVPILPGGKALLRSPLINIETFGTACFVSSFVDEAISEDGILLRLELGTRYGINEVIFEHELNGEFRSIGSIEDLSADVVRLLHVDPIQGLNRYRALVVLANGQRVVTDTIQNYFLTGTPFIVFPNPVAVAQDLNIFSGKYPTVQFVFHLFKSDGSIIRSAEILSDRETVDTSGIPPGLYLYRIEGEAGRFSGKLVIK